MLGPNLVTATFTRQVRASNVQPRCFHVGLTTRRANMIYVKSICVGSAFVLGSFCAVSFVVGMVLLPVAKEHGAVAFSISLRSPMFWFPSLLVFVAGFFWAYRRFSK